MKTPSQDPNRIANNAACARYRERNREKVKERQRKWRENNLARARELGLNHYRRKINESTPEELEELRIYQRTKQKEHHARNKDLVFKAYGGYVCKCCGEIEKAFLSIDHINNDGYVHRKSLAYAGTGSAFYGWLKRNKFPEGFQVLCMNCQFGKKKHGICPHQVRRNDYGYMPVGLSSPKRTAHSFTW